MKSIHSIALTRIAIAAIAWLMGVVANAATCTVAVTGVVLGSYTPNQVSPADSVGTVTLNCAAGGLDTLPMSVAYSLALSRGSAASFSPREMVSGGNRLRYNLYLDPLRLSIWGDTSGGTQSAAGSLALLRAPGTASASHSVYGRIFAAQNAVPGAYADSVVLTVTY